MSDLYAEAEAYIRATGRGTKLVEALLARCRELEGREERERLCHAACGVIAMSNTRESLAKVSEMPEDYLSASVKDCICAVTREIELREQLALADEVVEAAKEECGPIGPFNPCPKTREAITRYDEGRKR